MDDVSYHTVVINEWKSCRVADRKQQTLLAIDSIAKINHTKISFKFCQSLTLVSRVKTAFDDMIGTTPSENFSIVETSFDNFMRVLRIICRFDYFSFSFQFSCDDVIWGSTFYNIRWPINNGKRVWILHLQKSLKFSFAKIKKKEDFTVHRSIGPGIESGATFGML